MNGYAYLYDTIGRPTNRNANVFAYDRRGQVVSAALNTTTNTYAYDYAGNRTTSNDSIWGSTTWNANELNQYASGANHLFTYDLDGNMTSISDGTILTWDTHNRLVSITKDNVTSTYTYDYRHRRTSSTITIPTATTRHTFYYDDWNLIFEQVETWDSSTESWTLTRTLEYFWGTDLSGTLQGAGGIGGLLAVSLDGVFYFPCTDNLGNITAYISESGATVAAYEYDAFGNTIATAGSLDGIFPHRFSSKYYDCDTGLYYYGYRFYAPCYGRWINRDPIEEYGCNNLYVFVDNSSLNYADELGLKYGNPVTGPNGPVGPGFPSEPGGPYGNNGVMSSYSSFRRVQSLYAEWLNALKELRQAKDDMKKANVLFSDKYFHCIGSCKAARSGSKRASDTLGRLRELEELSRQRLLWHLKKHGIEFSMLKVKQIEISKGVFRDLYPVEHAKDSLEDYEANKLGFDCPLDKTCEECCCIHKVNGL